MLSQHSHAFQSSILTRHYREYLVNRRRSPFVMYSGGIIPIIVPAGLKGWVQLGLWLAMLAPLVLWFDTHLATDRHAPDFGAGVFLFIAGVAAWLIGGLWWMTVHSHVMPLVELRRSRQAKRREQKRDLES